MTITMSSRFASGNRIGPYCLLDVLGRGGFGEVWLAEKESAIAKVRVALKLPLSGTIDIDAVRHEAEIWIKAANHPNVLPIFEANIHDGQVVIASEYAPDGSLDHWLKRHGGKAPSVETAVDMAMGILSGLEHIHVRGVVHRDLKPANLLMQGEHPRIADFGLARPMDVVTTFQAAGTPVYMAPEAFMGQRTVQTDLWSAGIILYEMVNGHRPFPEGSLHELMTAINSSLPQPFSASVPPPVQEAVLIALRKDPAERYRSAADMRAALREAMRQAGGAVWSSGFMPVRGGRTIAITGSMRADVAVTAQRLKTLLPPYCGPHTTWYCGTSGVVDESVASFLLRAGQRVIAVGYNAADVSATMRSILKEFAAPFVDAKSEKVPADPSAPSHRDIFFSTKADLVIVLWDGQSQGTRKFIRWLQQQGKDHLLGYVRA